MNANDYCSAPPPLFLRRYAPIQSPPSAVHLIEMHC